MTTNISNNNAFISKLSVELLKIQRYLSASIRYQMTTIY